MRRHWFRWLAALFALAIIAAACGDDDDGDDVAADDTEEPAGDDEEVVGEEEPVPPEAGCQPAVPESVPAGSNLEAALAGELDGTSVSIRGSFVDEDANRFECAFSEFENQSGIDIDYAGSGDFEQLIFIDAEGGNAPDLGMIAQPGLYTDLARQGFLADMSGTPLEDITSENYIEDWQTLATVDGEFLGAFYRVSPKSLVWYPVPEFEEAGYTVPTTYEEMLALTDQIVADGNTPWCIGMESASATGWVATDWVEDIMLRLHGTDVYDQWVNHEIPFNDPQVVEAVQAMADIWLNGDYVFGGTTNILTVPFGDAMNPMFNDPPNCFLHRQANFIIGFWPDEVQADPANNVGLFYFPNFEGADTGTPVLGGGDIVVTFTDHDRPEVAAVAEFLATPEAAVGWAAQGGFISPNANFDPSVYPEGIDRQIGDILANATAFRFDGSDAMPAAVGNGTFWTGMVDLVNGSDLEGVLSSIEDSWPDE